MDPIQLASDALARARSRRQDRLGVAVTPEEIKAHLARYDFAAPVPLEALLPDV